MKKQLLFIAAFTVAGQALFFSSALADTGYNPSGNTTVSVNENLISAPSLGTGQMLFNLQEGLYQTSGADVNHDYVWLTVNGDPLLAIDPPAGMYSGEWCKR
ncbi:MAG: hypothetical protein OWU32_08395 [Firmicutes bacterium]|nr:hypothetical protein [Bacillota bacterium]